MIPNGGLVPGKCDCIWNEFVKGGPTLHDKEEHKRMLKEKVVF